MRKLLYFAYTENAELHQLQLQGIETLLFCWVPKTLWLSEALRSGNCMRGKTLVDPQAQSMCVSNMTSSQGKTR